VADMGQDYRKSGNHKGKRCADVGVEWSGFRVSSRVSLW
jgi:hypothetical protein